MNRKQHSKQKKKDQQRLKRAVSRHKDMLVRRLREDWDAAERRAKGEALIRYAKSSAAAVGRILLGLLLLAGTITIIAVAPNIFAAVDKMGRRRVFFEKEGMERARKYMIKKKLAVADRRDENKPLSLTEKGHARALFLGFQNLKIREQPQWDGIWRIIVFDIPDKKKWGRDTLRKGLRDIGFLQMQKSVFVSPYPCEEEVALLTAVCDASGHVRLIRTRELVHDHDIRKAFSLE